MEKVMVKRLISVCIVVILTFCIYVCAQTAVDNSVTEPETVESENTDAEPRIVEAKNTENDGENMAQENADKENADGDNAKTDTAVRNIESSVSVTMKTEVIPLIDENGITYYTLSSTYPVISIEGNESAAEKINADIRSRIEPFLSESESESYEWAKNWANYLNGTEAVYRRLDTGFNEDWTYEVTRADDNVISFAITECFYEGGLHEQFNTIGVSYDTNTGEQISFDDLSEDTEHFRMATLAYNQALAETEAYSKLMYPKDSKAIFAANTLEDVLYRDDKWYLSANGLVFLSNPYALGPFASGLIEFTIPYSDLEDMGFNEAYTYTGRLIVKLLDREIYSVDLNGDGDEETVAYYCFISDDTDTYIEKGVHLIIDGFDLGQDGDDDTKELLADYMYSDLVLYDLDINDDYVEVVLLTGWLVGRENTYYSNFFRYTKDGSLVYLGRVKGNVTDLSVSASEFENSDLQS